MDNARKELLEFLKENKLALKCALVEEVYYAIEKPRKFLLPVDYTPSQLKDFLAELDFEFDGGYGSQALGGTLWFTDGTWADRGEYDGSEWWELHKYPEIPKELLPSEREPKSSPTNNGPLQPNK